MHIPDGFLDPIWSISTYAVTIIYYIVGIKFTKAKLTPNKVSLITVLAAGIFVAQMLNWPLPGGTSLHFVGGALAGILLGPLYGAVTMGLVVTIQCLVFHDGGITALGANLLNMAIIDVLIGYLLYKLTINALGEKPSSAFIGGFLGGWLGIVLAGIACGFEIGLSPLFPYGIAITIPVMGFWHFVIGVIEGIITGSVIAYIASKCPSLLWKGGSEK